MQSVSSGRFVIIMSTGGGHDLSKKGILRTVESATMVIGLPMRLDKRMF